MNRLVLKGSNRNLSRDREIVEMWMSGMKLEEVGERFNLTRERVRQIIKERGVPHDAGGSYRQVEDKRQILNTPCKHEGCNRKRQLHNEYCRRHETQIEKSGTTICLIDDCGKDIRCNGLCNKHYASYLRRKKERRTNGVEGFINSINRSLRAGNLPKLTEEEKSIAEENGLELHTVRDRIKSGWNVDVAITSPVVRRPDTKIYEVYRDGKLLIVGDAENCASEIGVSLRTFRNYASDLYQQQRNHLPGFYRIVELGDD